MSNPDFYKLYYKIIFNINKLSHKDLNKELNKLQLLQLSGFLKDKFKDKRTINNIYQLILTELKDPLR